MSSKRRPLLLPWLNYPRALSDLYRVPTKEGAKLKLAAGLRRPPFCLEVDGSLTGLDCLPSSEPEGGIKQIITIIITIIIIIQLVIIMIMIMIMIMMSDNVRAENDSSHAAFPVSEELPCSRPHEGDGVFSALDLV